MMTTAIRLFATFVGYVTIFLWVLGCLGIGDFIMSFRLK